MASRQTVLSSDRAQVASYKRFFATMIYLQYNIIYDHSTLARGVPWRRRH